MNRSALVNIFAKRVIEATDYLDDDKVYLINQILGIVGESSYMVTPEDSNLEKLSTLDILDQLIMLSKSNGTLANRQMNEDMLGAQLMNLFVPRPSQVNKLFWTYYQVSPESATNYLFELSKRSNYIKTREISQNISFPAPTNYGELQITINLSKPEKDPKAIAAAAAMSHESNQKLQYPASQLARENEGYWGRLDYAARTNHRVVPLTLGGETWYFQYSPYAYFNEHAIVLSQTIRPMHIDEENMARLLEFVTQFPDYFIGSNADLPIVGGSILSHDHFQAGRYELPMAKAAIKQKIYIANVTLDEAGVLNWPMTAIRLIDKNKNKLLKAAMHVIKIWHVYDDTSLSIKSYDENGTPHHTVTPIVRYRHDRYEIDLVLRDNNVSDVFPDGIFHPHPDVQHIKKENIGLIEVMGLAILPPRLKKELVAVEDFLLEKVDHVASKHQAWADQLLVSHEVNTENVENIVQQSVGQIFKRVLEDAGIFKSNDTGQQGLQKFIHEIE